MNAVIFEQIMSLLGLIALWVFWYYLWKPQRVDAFRQELFDLRTELFDLAASRVVSFDHPAYTELRLMINGVIRFAHQISLPPMVVAMVQSKQAPFDPLSAWRKKVQELPEDARNQILAIHDGVSVAFAKHLIGGSLILFVYVASRVLYSITKAFLQLVAGKRDIHNFTVSRARNKVDREATEVAKAGVKVIEARVLHEEQHRTAIKRDQAYAN
jgi:hypothetical protein